MKVSDSNPADSRSKKHKNRHLGDRRIICVAIMASLLMTSLFCIFITLVFFKPTAIFNLGFISKFFLLHPQELNKSEHLNTILPLISNGTIMSINDLWNFQNSLYQTIITVLIGLNAALATLSFFMIRNSSGNAAREEAIKEVERHIASQAFNDRVKKIIHKKLKSTEIDFNHLQDLLSEITDTTSLHKDEIASIKTSQNKFNNDVDGINKQINIIAGKIAEDDNEEDNFTGTLTSVERER